MPLSLSNSLPGSRKPRRLKGGKGKEKGRRRRKFFGNERFAFDRDLGWPAQLHIAEDAMQWGKRKERHQDTLCKISMQEKVVQ